MFPPPSTVDAAQAAVQGKSIDDIFAALKTTRLGLSSEEAARRLASARQAQPGARARLPLLTLPAPARALVARAFAQVADPVHLVLLLCALAGATLGAPAMAGAIVVLTALRVLLLAAIETHGDAVQAQLRDARAGRARVRRDGSVASIAASALVPGDVIELAAGARVPADVRLFEHDALVIDQVPVHGDDPMVWTDAWVSSGRGAGIVMTVGADAASAALNRLAGQDSGTANALLIEAGTQAPNNAPSSAVFAVRLDRNNIAVLAVAMAVLLAGALRGSGWLHNALAAVTLAAMLWSAQARLAAPIRRLAAIRGARRLMAGGAFVRDIDIVERLAALPADDEAAAAPLATITAAITVTTAGIDDTDRARQAADLIVDAPAADLARMAAPATRISRRAIAAAERALAFGAPAALALLASTTVLAAVLLPSWPASVPLALHVLLFALCAALALIPGDGAVVLDTPARSALERRAVDVLWAVALTAAAFGVTRLATRFSVDTATLAFAALASGCLAFAWSAACLYRREGWAMQRPELGKARDVVWLALCTLGGVAATIAAIHVPRWQSAFETAALSRATWALAAGVGVAAVVLVLATLFVSQRWQHRRAAAGTAVSPSAAAEASAPNRPQNPPDKPA